MWTPKIIEISFYLKQSWCLKDQSWSEKTTLHENKFSFKFYLTESKLILNIKSDEFMHIIFFWLC